MSKKVIRPQEKQLLQLSERERDILRSIIHMYILNAQPVGSRTLSKHLYNYIKLSPATIRNIMADLEEMDLISHPHTSAGRIPTDKGYRYYVDTMMHNEELSPKEKNVVKESFDSCETEQELREATKLLSFLSNCLAIVEIPHFKDLLVQKLELIQLSSTRLLVILALDSNVVRTMTVEVEFDVTQKDLTKITQYLNDRISGKPLKFIQTNFREIISESLSVKPGLIRLFVDSVDRLLSSNLYRERLHIAGTQHLLENPEFENVEQMRSVIELIEDEDVIIHVLDKNLRDQKDINILIGQEMNNKLLQDYSLIATRYSIGTVFGSIGIIGPKRMNYSHLTSLVQYFGNVINNRDEL